MVRIVDNQKRRDDILSSAIEAYISSCMPVSSDILSKETGFSLSPATIRNVMADLENDGYLSHPHTSAGRVPTEKGYRYYVDFLMPEEDLLAENKAGISQAFSRYTHDIEEFLDSALGLLCENTHCAGIASFLEWDDKIFYKGASKVLEQPEFRDVNRVINLVKVFEEKQRLFELINRDMERYLKVYIGKELDDTLDNCSLVVSNYRKKDKPCGRLAVLGPTRLNYKQVVPLLEYVSASISDILSIDG